jgi:hypothetical protein
MFLNTPQQIPHPSNPGTILRLPTSTRAVVTVTKGKMIDDNTLKGAAGVGLSGSTSTRRPTSSTPAPSSHSSRLPDLSRRTMNTTTEPSPPLDPGPTYEMSSPLPMLLRVLPAGALGDGWTWESGSESLVSNRVRARRGTGQGAVLNLSDADALGHTAAGTWLPGHGSSVSRLTSDASLLGSPVQRGCSGSISGRVEAG